MVEFFLPHDEAWATESQSVLPGGNRLRSVEGLGAASPDS